MTSAVEKFVHIAGRHLLALNLVALVALVALKLVLPYGGLEMATISQSLAPLDTSVVVADTNAARVAVSLAPLARNALLDAAADQKLSDMESKGYFEHVSPDGTVPWNWISAQGYRYRAAGENLAKGFDTPDSVVGAWMHSLTHRANIVSTQYTDIGVAARYITLGGYRTMVVVQMFASPLPVAAPAPVSARVVGKPFSQAVSTDRHIAQVTGPIAVPVTLAGTAQLSRGISSGLAIYLSGLMALLALCMVVVGPRRSIGWALAGNMALLAILIALPIATGHPLIF